MYSDIITAQCGDAAAKEKVISENMGLVYSVARRFTGRGCEFEDLCQIGCIGLIKAAERFDVCSGNRFSTYAVPMIMGEIKRFLRDDGAVKVSRSLKELSARIYRLRERNGFSEYSVSDIAKELGEEEGDVARAIQSMSAVASYNELSENGCGMKSENDCFSDTDNRIMIEDMLSNLSENDRKIIILRYFKQKTQSETAELTGTSQVWVSRREKKILGMLRGFMI